MDLQLNITPKRFPKEYRAWRSMKARCYNPRTRNYKDYGGRGIEVCDKWRGSFEAFFLDMGISKPHLSLDRRENDGDYCPGNCRWSTRHTQLKNRRSSTQVRADRIKYGFIQPAAHKPIPGVDHSITATLQLTKE